MAISLCQVHLAPKLVEKVSLNYFLHLESTVKKVVHVPSYLLMSVLASVIFT